MDSTCSEKKTLQATRWRPSSAGLLAPGMRSRTAGSGRGSPFAAMGGAWVAWCVGVVGAGVAVGLLGACGASRTSGPAAVAAAGADVVAERGAAPGSATPSAAGQAADPGVPAVLARADTLRVDAIAPGVRRMYAWDARGPWAIHVLEVDAEACGPVYEARKAGPPQSARATTSALAADALAAINADFFRLPGGTTVGAHVQGGEVVAGPAARPVLALAVDGRWWIGRAALRGTLARARGGERLPIVQVNRPAAADSVGAVLFTGWIGDDAPEAAGVTTVFIRGIAAGGAGSPGTPGTPRVGVVVRVDTAGAPARPERGGVAVWGRGRVAEWLRRLAPGDTVVWEVALVPEETARQAAPGAVSIGDRSGGAAAAAGAAERGGRSGASAPGGKAAGAAERAAALEAVGGYPVLLRDGRIAPDISEGVSPDFGERRHPRTAVGLAGGGRRMLWVVVDGRQEPYSVGMSLAELATLLQGLGAEEAINLDGGGSSALVVEGAVVNRPSDRTGERAVGNALALVACRARG